MTTYRLLQPSAPAVPVLDASQQSVVDHPGGPLLVLAGPGTGKTTTMVEAIVARVERGTDPDRILALTFSRKAAEQLREKVTARLGITTSGALASTFHSFAYGLVRRYASPELYAAPLRLLSAAEQDVIIRDLLEVAPESVAWPERLRAAVGTRGFAREVQALLARARERMVDGQRLQEIGEAEGIAAYVAAGEFLEQYLDVLDHHAAIDYADLMGRAVIEAALHRTELRQAYDLVLVDEYQDSDPSQVMLLQQLAGDGHDLIVVGDPDQSIYGFRGADVRGILDFPDQFRTATGEPASTIALGTTRRFGPRLLEASRRVARALPVSGSIPREAYEIFRDPRCLGDTDHGVVEALTFDTPRAEVDHIADMLRRAHLIDGVPWSRMAVLVRSGRSEIPTLRRALTAAGVPVEVAADEVPLVREPAVRTLLDALRVVVDCDVQDREDPRFVTGEAAVTMLTSPLGGLDASDLRVLLRGLRAEQPGDALVDLQRRLLLDPTAVADVPGIAAERARRCADLVQAAAVALASGDSAEQLLWLLWESSGWSRRLAAAAASGGSAGRWADRDLDAVVALFDTAARLHGQQEHISPAEFQALLEAQQIPADTLADRGVRGEAVRLLTAHRAKGLEWDVVVVAHVQEGAWPDLRQRGTLLQSDRLSSGGLLPPVTRAALLAEERRLFYVAATRARQRLIVTAVASSDEDGEQPSRFLSDLSDGDPVRRSGRPPRQLSMVGLVSELRRVAADPAEPDQRRRAAAVRLRRLSAVAPAADPRTWWGVRELTCSDVPLRPEQEPIRLSASALEGIMTCPAKWFLEREAGGSRPSTSSQGFGTIVHALAERVANGELGDATVADLMVHVDEVWGRMSWRTPWSAARGRADVADVLERFLAWHRRPGARTIVGLEHKFDVVVELPDGVRVQLKGAADRLELDEDGDVVVVDLKTGKYPPSDKSLPENAQLGVYQLAVDHGAVAEQAPGARSGGAELVQLRKEVRGKAKVQRQAPPEPGRPLAVVEQLDTASRAIREESFVARPGDHCRFCEFSPICPSTSAGSVLS
ncbi:ATP-dependent helicase [Nocardioides baekrokdamisoli]|nr:ATP-dependent DNA helicase [Nocardioides baekrokdamisoli]